MSVQAAFLVQQRDGRGRWGTVTVAPTRPMANRLARELRRALVESPYSPAAAVRVVSDAELAREMRMGRVAGAAAGGEGSPVVVDRPATPSLV